LDLLDFEEDPFEAKESFVRFVAAPAALDLQRCDLLTVLRLEPRPLGESGLQLVLIPDAES
jgi:hypothetical protein